MKKGIIKKIIASSAAALISLSAFACSRASGNDYKSTTIQGRVSSIDDKTLSLSVMPSPGEGEKSANKPGNPPDAQGSGDSSAFPDKPDDSPSSSDSSQSEDSSSKAPQDNNGGTPPDKPGDSSDNSQSSGNAPADMPEEESVTISLSSSTVYTSSGEEISSSDIK